MFIAAHGIELWKQCTSGKKHAGFARLGIHHIRLEPGHRTSFPHAESAEDEFVYVIAGTPDVWLDGVVHRLHRVRPSVSRPEPAWRIRS